MRIGGIFIDAGYVFGAGSDLLFGRVHRRRDLRLQDAAGLVAQLDRMARACCEPEDLRILRTYWYDGAVNGLPTPDQVEVGSLPRVKLRLGRINAGGQKGVDGLIILDLITLATNRAIDTAIVVSGDEDLREAALHAQSFGVSVVLVGLPPTRQQRQSELLIREADHHLVFEKDSFARHLDLVSPPTAGPVLPTSSQVEAGTAVAVALDEGDTDAQLVKMADELIGDPRFAGLADIVLPEDPSRLTRRADRVLVARLAEITGVFPVERQLLERARKACVEAAGSAYGAADAAG